MPETNNGTSLAASRAELPEVLVVEDEAIARTELKEMLKKSGFRVRAARSGREAIRKVKSGEVGVVLMDIVLSHRGPDGIDTAREIQQSHPGTSVIFVSAYAQNPAYRQRAQSDVIHIAGWIEKPIRVPEIPQLVDTVTAELIKVKKARTSPEPDMISLSARINAVYDEIRALITSQAGKPGLRDSLVPLREKLRALQEQEAEQIAMRYDAFFRPNLDEAKLLVEQARQQLRKT